MNYESKADNFKSENMQQLINNNKNMYRLAANIPNSTFASSKSVF